MDLGVGPCEGADHTHIYIYICIICICLTEWIGQLSCFLAKTVSEFLPHKMPGSAFEMEISQIMCQQVSDELPDIMPEFFVRRHMSERTALHTSEKHIR
jgi:hypothetical protein